MKDKDSTQNSETCFTLHEKLNKPCQKTQCRSWFENTDNCNCVILAAKHGPRTLEEVGQLFKLTRMRICQIESNVKRKLHVIS